ncbi:unnamed protein product [Brassica oleracea]
MDLWEEKMNKREKMHEHFDMILYVTDVHYGILNRCLCSERVIDEIRGENSQVYLSYHLHEPNERRNKQILKLNYKAETRPN